MYFLSYSPKFAEQVCGNGPGRINDPKPCNIITFWKYGYSVRRTAPDTSHQNSPDEGHHRYIGEAVRSPMEGYQFQLKLFPYALSQYIKLQSMVPHGESELSYDEKILKYN